jgi:hypothetical protein
LLVYVRRYLFGKHSFSQKKKKYRLFSSFSKLFLDFKVKKSMNDVKHVFEPKEIAQKLLQFF